MRVQEVTISNRNKIQSITNAREKKNFRKCLPYKGWYGYLLNYILYTVLWLSANNYLVHHKLIILYFEMFKLSILQEWIS